MTKLQIHVLKRQFSLYISAMKYGNNKITNDDGPVTFHVPNWVKSVNVEIPNTNVKFCLRLIVKDDSGRRLFEAIRPSNVMVIDGDYGPVKH